MKREAEDGLANGHQGHGDVLWVMLLLVLNLSALHSMEHHILWDVICSAKSLIFPGLATEVMGVGHNKPLSKRSASLGADVEASAPDPNRDSASYPIRGSVSDSVLGVKLISSSVKKLSAAYS